MRKPLRLLLASILIFPALLPAKPYKGAEIRTHASFLYGRFEVRMRSAEMSGMLSSLFTFHDSPDLPQEWNEIDIEHMGRYRDRTQFNIITPGTVNHELHVNLPFNPHADFHTYAIEWTPDYVAWHVDDVEIIRELRSHVQTLIHPQKLMFNIWPPDIPDWAGPFDPADLPVYAYYDWIRYYRYTPGVNGNFTLEWEDHFDQFDVSRWGKGTHTWNGNNCDFIAANAVIRDGYAILCLTTEAAVGYHGGPVIETDVTPPYIQRARRFGDNIDVHFSEPLDPASVADGTNWITSPATITGAFLLADQRTVRLTTEGGDSSLSANLVVRNIRDLATPPNTMPLTVQLLSPPLGNPLHINVAGEEWQNFRAGQTFVDALDYGATGGTNIDHGDSRDFADTDADPVYRKERRGITFYDARLGNGVYDVTLMLAETVHSGAGSRVFDVYAEEALRLENVDIYGLAGNRQFAAVEVTIPAVTVADQRLSLYFDAVTDVPVLSGLRVTRVATPIAPEHGAVLPREFEWRVFPNPFNPATTVEFALDRSGVVDLRVYNLLGQVVTEPLRDAARPAGTHRQRIAAATLFAGVYFVELRLDGRRLGIRKAVVLK